VENRIERAVRDASSRLSAAVECAARYYVEERDILVRSVGIATEHLQRSDISAEDRRETEESLHLFQRQLQELDAGWRTSTVRKAAKGAEERTETSGIEQRVALAAPAMPAGFTRAAGTSTKNSVRSRLVGYAAVFREKANIAGLFTEEIMPGAFQGVLHDDVTLNYQHQDDLGVLSRTPGSLRLSEDSRGLRIEGDLLNPDPMSSAIRRRILTGRLSKMSFAFSDVTDRWTFATKEGDLDHRQILRVGKLWDVACVSRPAYSGTSIWVVDDKRAADVPHEPSAAERLSPHAYLRQAEAEEDAEWDRVRDLAALQRRLGIVTPAQRAVQRKYEKLGRLIDRNRMRN
jgi:uncharacterized protein